MDTPQALLIQGISEYQTLIRKALRGIIESYGLEGAYEEEALHWIIAEYLERVHLLEVEGHGSRLRFWEALTANVDASLQGELWQISSFYIKAPRLYGLDKNRVTIRVRGIDLWIWYFK